MKAKRIAVIAGALLAALAVASPALGASNAWQDVWAQIKPLLSDPGTINNTENPVHWTKLKGVPAGLSDGLDNGVDRAGFGLRKNVFPNLEFAVDTTKVQKRITGGCPGQTVEWVNADGSVVCGTAAPVVFLGRRDANSSMHVVGDDWASIGGVFDLPAGRWALTAKVQFSGGGNYDIDGVSCQLATWSGSKRIVLDDGSLVAGAPDGLDDVPANVTVPFVGVLDTSAPSEVGVMCRDSGNGVSWQHVRILATQASELHIQTMHAG